MSFVTTVGEWKGHKKVSFTVGGRESYFVCPEKPAPGARWAWRAEFFGAFDGADLGLLKAGWYLAYHRVSDMYGCPKAIEYMSEFQDVMVRGFGMNEKTVLIGVSRGGLYSFNYAAAHPERVAALYLDAPVLDIKSWPVGLGRGDSGGDKCRRECLEWYGLTLEEIRDFHGNPLDYAEKVAKSGIPMIIVAGDADTAVPLEENAAIMEKLFTEAGGKMKMIVKPGCGHHPHGLDDPSPIVDFIISACG